MKSMICLVVFLSLLGLSIAPAQQSPPRRKTPRLTNDDIPESRSTSPAPPEAPPTSAPAGAKTVATTWYQGADGYVRAVDEARKTGSPLVVYFYTDWCGYCKRLDKELLPTPEMGEFLKRTVKVKINPETNSEAARVAEQFNVDGFPSFFIVPKGNTSPKRVHPFKSAGGKPYTMTPAEFAGECANAASA